MEKLKAGVQGPLADAMTRVEAKAVLLEGADSKKASHEMTLTQASAELSTLLSQFQSTDAAPPSSRTNAV